MSDISKAMDGQLLADDERYARQLLPSMPGAVRRLVERLDDEVSWLRKTSREIAEAGADQRDEQHAVWRTELETLKRDVADLRAALIKITSLGRTCADFETCAHSACNDSAGAVLIALEALKGNQGSQQLTDQIAELDSLKLANLLLYQTLHDRQNCENCRGAGYEFIHTEWGTDIIECWCSENAQETLQYTNDPHKFGAALRDVLQALSDLRGIIGFTAPDRVIIPPSRKPEDVVVVLQALYGAMDALEGLK